MYIKTIFPTPDIVGRFLCIQFNDPLEIEFTTKFFTDKEDSFCLYITSENPNEIIGATILELEETNVHISWFAVNSKFRNQGYGTLLIEHLKQKFKSITLWCWIKNSTGHTFYRKNGFIEIYRNSESIFYKWIQKEQ